jgi:membrane protease YdiL (CAAX protease family)
MNTELYISILLVILTSALLVITGLRKQPGIGVIATLVIIALALWLRGNRLTTIGLSLPASWITTILLAFVLGILIQLLSVGLIEPVSEKLTKRQHDFSVLDSVKGNWKALIQWLLMVWILVALLEETVYRGFLMSEIVDIIGTGTGAIFFNVIFTSIVFGLSHGYQGPSGMFSTGLVGLLLAILFVWNGYNLWLPILTHGFIDTIGISLIAIDGDKRIRQFIWKEKKSS